MIRYRIETAIGNTYFLFDEECLMATVADENDPTNAEHRALMETMCRLASKALKAGVPLSVIRDQLIAGDMGRNTIVLKLANKIGEYLDGRKS
jgi:hypothetical protein